MIFVSRVLLGGVCNLMKLLRRIEDGGSMRYYFRTGRFDLCNN